VAGTQNYYGAAIEEKVGFTSKFQSHLYFFPVLADSILY